MFKMKFFFIPIDAKMKFFFIPQSKVIIKCVLY